MKIFLTILNIILGCLFVNEKVACDKAIKRAEQAEEWTEIVQAEIENMGSALR
jgi:regulatory protein YycI of two-component signal transduction system YycFG